MKISIASGKGGTGKTTIATNLAVALSSAGKDVLYLDCDVEEPNGHIFLKPVIEEHYCWIGRRHFLLQWIEATVNMIIGRLIILSSLVGGLALWCLAILTTVGFDISYGFLAGEDLIGYGMVVVGFLVMAYAIQDTVLGRKKIRIQNYDRRGTMRRS